ncbi:glycosyl transferase family 2 [Burkholderia sp. PAMC 28687]|uniref:glycosyltransferase family 2 protein n=1 Tax=Burkholderia sp. PAMC 28687 TaxID=1795874 RepID=UPI000785F065|nr:glycosyltransferase [Burkholderia sp. PAMC 28687]AMM17451.1 glycosyl transferase family 2 [Burkholderia sp. PAMC 28687]
MKSDAPNIDFEPVPETAARARISVVVLTYNRCAQVLETLSRLCALPEQPRVVVVDNGSTDGTPQQIAECFPYVTLIIAQTNLGAAGRNVGVSSVTTEYVAFCDDDTWWHAGSLQRAVQLLDSAPRVGVLNARILVNEAGETDDTCQLMARSPLDAAGLPGPSLIGYMAGACVFRTLLYRQIGGYEPRLFIGGEEELVALDVLASGFAIVYADELVLHHHPSPIRDSSLRRRMLARNAAWVAWMRLPWREAWNTTRVAIKIIRREGTFPRDAFSLFAALPWALARRRAIPDDVARMRRAVHLAERTYTRY